MTELKNFRKDVVFRTKSIESPNPDVMKSTCKPPNNGYLGWWGLIATVIACLCIFFGCLENTIIAAAGLILFFLGIAIMGIGTLVDTINANTEELKKWHNP